LKDKYSKPKDAFIGKFVKDNFEFIEFTKEESKNPILKLHDFLHFLDRDNVLHGFNLSRDLKCKLFAWLDPHRKGYLSLQDWLMLFDKKEDVESIV
jgi:hypothetical protein